MNASPPRSSIKWDKSVMKLNNDNKVVEANIYANIRKQFPQLQAFEANTQHIAIVGGGPSLVETFDELLELYHDGVKIVALNGAGNWLMERNIRPSMQVVLDSRPANIDFVKKPIPHCKYFLASQCDPSLLDACTERNTTIFHVITDDDLPERARLDKFYNKRWAEVPPAGTVGVCTIMMCRILGFQYIHLFGLDSCYSEGEIKRHHAYEQPINDGDGYAEFQCADRTFYCSAWQASQAQNFLEVIQHYGHLFNLNIHGNGLLAHMLAKAAEGPIGLDPVNPPSTPASSSEA